MLFGDALHIETAEAANYHIDIPTGGRATMRAGLGSPVYGTQHTAGVFMPGRPVEFDFGERFAQISLMIPRDLLQLEVESLLGVQPARPLEFSTELDLATAGSRMMMQTLRMIDEASDQEGGPLAHPLATQRLEQVLIHSLLFAQPHNHSAALEGPSPAAGARPVSHAVELMRNSPAHPWTVTELAAEVSLSVRSLQEGFRRSMDTTPMAYLRHLRLEKVHEELATAAPGTVSVTEVAARWGSSTSVGSRLPTTASFRSVRQTRCGLGARVRGRLRRFMSGALTIGSRFELISPSSLIYLVEHDEASGRVAKKRGMRLVHRGPDDGDAVIFGRSLVACAFLLGILTVQVKALVRLHHELGGNRPLALREPLSHVPSRHRKKSAP